jgi:hypothetical protein
MSEDTNGGSRESMVPERREQAVPPQPRRPSRAELIAQAEGEHEREERRSREH